MLTRRVLVVGVAALTLLPACSEFNGERYALASDVSHQVIVLACAEEDLAKIKVWLLNDGKIVGDDQDELQAEFEDDEWSVDGDVFALQTGVQWGSDIGVSVVPSKNAPFAARLSGSVPDEDDVLKFPKGDIESRAGFIAAC